MSDFARLTFYFSSGQVFPIHPLDLVPKSTTNPGTCVGSFVSVDISAIAPAAGNLYAFAKVYFTAIANQDVNFQ